VLEFLDILRSDKRILDWQPRQADDAIRLYYFNFLGNARSKVSGGIATTDITGALKEMRRLIRLRHYSYSTERAYLQWAEKFPSYTIESQKRDVVDVATEDFKNFLSHLAIKQRVSASTQNQAFNAILFLFRNVLGKETADIGDTVRAKRGQKLPVVLSVDEVKALFQHLSGTSLLMSQMLYGSGLRLMELVRLRVKDIDFNSNLLFVRSGKGDKDRSTILPEVVKDALQHISL
jgi:site-specific recombinase XerD